MSQVQECPGLATDPDGVGAEVTHQAVSIHLQRRQPAEFGGGRGTETRPSHTRGSNSTRAAALPTLSYVGSGVSAAREKLNSSTTETNISRCNELVRPLTRMRSSWVFPHVLDTNAAELVTCMHGRAFRGEDGEVR